MTLNASSTTNSSLNFCENVFSSSLFTAISSNPTTTKCYVSLNADIFQSILYAATTANSQDTNCRGMIPALLQCLALKFPGILALSILHAILTCSILISLSHLDRTMSDYKMAFQNVWGWGVWERGQAGRKNITLKYIPIRGAWIS